MKYIIALHIRLKSQLKNSNINPQNDFQNNHNDPIIMQIFLQILFLRIISNTFMHIFKRSEPDKY